MKAITLSPYLALSQVPVVVSVALAAATDDTLPAPTGWLSLIERFGLPVVAAAASAWVAYRLASAVIERAWKREDDQDRRLEDQTKRWEEMNGRNIAALTQVETGLREVAEGIKTCRQRQ